MVSLTSALAGSPVGANKPLLPPTARPRAVGRRASLRCGAVLSPFTRSTSPSKEALAEEVRVRWGEWQPRGGRVQCPLMPACWQLAPE